MESETTNADEQFDHLTLTDAINEKTESIAVFNLSVSLTGLAIGGLSLLGQSAMIASGGWFVGSVGSFVEDESHLTP